MNIRVWFRALAGGPLRRKRLEQLKDVVDAHLPMLPVADAQLRDASRQMEQAVSEIGAHFGRMVDGARQGVNEAARLVGGGGEAGDEGIGALLSGSRATLEDLMARIVRDGEICQTLVQRMDSFARNMERIVKGLAEVDRVSFGNTILALNAKIEAAHIGDRGQGFEIVAQELWQQARQSEEITETIRATVLHLSADAKEAEAEIAAMTCADSERTVALAVQVRQALGRLESAHADMRQTVTQAGGRSESLAREISGAVQTLQFQDRVSQRIGHIVEALESMQAAIEEQLAPLGGRSAEVVGSAAAELLSHSYTMEGERAVHAAALGGEQSAGSESDNVELF